MIALHAPCGHATTSYTVTDLGVLPGYGTSSAATAINDLGDAIGQSTVIAVDGSASSRPFLWHAGVITDISNQGQFNNASSINNAGQVLVQGEVVYSGGQFHVFNVGASGVFLAINGHGTILGRSPSGSFLFLNQMVYQPIANALGTPFSSPSVINDKNQMAGFYNFANFFHAASWQNALAYPKDLGALGSDPGNTPSGAAAINNKGEVAGYSGTARYVGNFSDRFHAVLFTGGKIKDLGTLGYDFSQAVAINDSDTIIGWCQSQVSGNTTVFVYQSGAMYDLNTHLNTHGWTVQSVAGINNVGQIAATVSSPQFPNGHAVVLNPIMDKKGAELVQINQ